MRNSLRNMTPEAYFAFAALLGILLAAALTQIPILAFGSFWLMAAALVGSDVVVYLAVKLGLIKIPERGNGAA
ncbi:MAG TPA: hypothetical protein VM939_05700 [Gemmatimonadaceae bacterium]|nr:hypothetical protein [Gemmatimonadaceae bacterium]